MNTGAPIGDFPRDSTWNSVADILERLISPGRRSRLSPFVESVQLDLLFGETPDPARHVQDVRRIVQSPSSQIRLDELAAIRRRFVQAGMRFEASKYDRNFLCHYLVQYTSVNVPKVQLALLDAVRADAIPSDLHVLDLGVGSSTTAVAIVDFLLLLGDVCRLTGVEFPVSSFGLKLVDASSSVLHFAQQAHASMIKHLRQVQRSSDTMDDLREMLVNGLEASEYHEADLCEAASGIDGCSLWVASYVLGEGGVEQRAYKSLAESFVNSSESELFLIIEPGDPDGARRARALREECFQSSEHVHSLGPCAPRTSEAAQGCLTCWRGRQEDFNRSELHASFRSRFEGEEAEKRGELSWSYALLRLHAERGGDLGGITGELYRVMGYSRLRGKPGLCVRLCDEARGTSDLRLDLGAGYVFPHVPYGGLVRLGGIERCEPDTLRPLGPDDFMVSAVIGCREESGIRFQADSDALDAFAQRLFGFRRLHGFQTKVISRVLAGRSTFAIAATGGGKSECYILPAVLSPGVTVVVSPLKSLMSDQYEARVTDRYGLGRLAAVFNGDRSAQEREDDLALLESGFIKLAFFTPEQLQNTWVLEALARANDAVGVSLVTFDEAHCISQWGHDFRPAYLNILRRLKDYGVNATVLALTATASPTVREDVCKELGLDIRDIDEGGDLYVESGHRAEINWVTKQTSPHLGKGEWIAQELSRFLRESDEGSAIVFMPWTGRDEDHSSRELDTLGASPRVTEYAAFLERVLETRVAIYHGGMEAAGDPSSTAHGSDRKPGDMRERTRAAEQAAFMTGDMRIMVATKGFGMGVDKPDIRLVLHRTLPTNLEAYAQEAGRAGRDGRLADAVLAYDGSMSETVRPVSGTRPPATDYDIQHLFLDGDRLVRKDLEDFLDFVLQRSRRAGVSVYFTTQDYWQWLSDEGRLSRLIDDMQPRRSSGSWESPEHASVLDLGHQFNGLSKHIDTVLTVLHKTRPRVPGGSMVLVERFDSGVGTLLARQPPQDALRAMCDSNAYFGRALRAANVDHRELAELLRSGSVSALADRLAWSLTDTARLLSDARSAIGRGDWWTAPRYLSGIPETTADKARWLCFAGAWGRSYVDKARRSTMGPEEELVAYFWNKHSRPRGWEVHLGHSAASSSDVRRQVEAVMQMHDARRRHARQAFERFLHDYVGDVESDGRDASCLKSIMLGYLRTNEVVLGNCLSCIRCCPDGNFSNDLDQRRERVAKLPPSSAAKLERFSSASQPPIDWDMVDSLLELMGAEVSDGARVGDYLLGLSGRLLDDDASHVTALVVRLLALAIARDTSRASEAASLLSTALDVLETDDAGRLLNALPGDSPFLGAAVVQLAHLARRAADTGREADLLARALRETPDGLAVDTVDRAIHILGLESDFSDSRAWRAALALRLEMERSAGSALTLWVGWGHENGLLGTLESLGANGVRVRELLDLLDRVDTAVSWVDLPAVMELGTCLVDEDTVKILVSRTSRLLRDEPEHASAAMMCLLAMAEGLVDPEDDVEMLALAAAVGLDEAEYGRAVDAVAGAAGDSERLFVGAEILGGLGACDKEAELLWAAVENSAQRASALTRLSELYSSGGALEEEKLYAAVRFEQLAHADIADQLELALQHGWDAAEVGEVLAMRNMPETVAVLMGRLERLEASAGDVDFELLTQLADWLQDQAVSAIILGTTERLLSANPGHAGAAILVLLAIGRGTREPGEEIETLAHVAGPAMDESDVDRFGAALAGVAEPDSGSVVLRAMILEGVGAYRSAEELLWTITLDKDLRVQALSRLAGLYSVDGPIADDKGRAAVVLERAADGGLLRQCQLAAQHGWDVAYLEAVAQRTRMSATSRELLLAAFDVTTSRGVVPRASVGRILDEAERKAATARALSRWAEQTSREHSSSAGSLAVHCLLRARLDGHMSGSQAREISDLVQTLLSPADRLWFFEALNGHFAGGPEDARFVAELAAGFGFERIQSEFLWFAVSRETTSDLETLDWLAAAFAPSGCSPKSDKRAEVVALRAAAAERSFRDACRAGSWGTVESLVRPRMSEDDFGPRLTEAVSLARLVVAILRAGVRPGWAWFGELKQSIEQIDTVSKAVLYETIGRHGAWLAESTRIKALNKAARYYESRRMSSSATRACSPQGAGCQLPYWTATSWQEAAALAGARDFFESAE